jgi:DNA-binding transcriptional MocR family regulator
MAAEKAALYQDVALRLRAAISDGTYPPGAQLPSESEVAETYGVSRNTARRTFAALREDGLISSHQGARRIVLAEPGCRTSTSCAPSPAGPADRRGAVRASVPCSERRAGHARGGRATRPGPGGAGRPC